MKKKDDLSSPTSDSEPVPERPREIVPDPEQQEAILQEVLDSVRKYREYKRRKEEDPPP